MTIKWDETKPADADAVGMGAQEVRSIKSSIAAGLGLNLEFPGSGGGDAAIAGMLKPGSSRFFVSAEGATDLDDKRGFGVLHSDTSRLFVKTSDDTVLVGTPQAVENSLNSGIGRKWLMASETTIYDISAYGKSQDIAFDTFTGTTSPLAIARFGDTPTVLVSSNDTRVSLGVSSVTAGGFTSQVSFSGTSQDFELTWIASGWTDDGTI